MSYIGFKATLADGTEIRECDVRCWDDMPGGIRKLALWREWHEEIAVLEGSDGKFFFYNEAAALRGGMGALAAKGIGYVENGMVREIRIEAGADRLREALAGGYTPDLDVQNEVTYPIRFLRFEEHHLRQAA